MHVLMLSFISEEKLRRRVGGGINFPSLKRESLFEVGGRGEGANRGVVVGNKREFDSLLFLVSKCMKSTFLLSR